MASNPVPSMANVPSEAGISAKPRAPWYTCLDGFRGLALLMVAFNHSALYSAFYQESPRGFWEHVAAGIIGLSDLMWIAAPVFFVISGYCISATLDGVRTRAHPVRWFFFRRLYRIYPPYWIMLVIGIGAVWSLDNLFFPHLYSDDHFTLNRPESLSPAQWFGNLTLIETWRHFFFGEEPKYFLALLWTLCYEEQMYAMMGLLLLVARQRFFQTAFIFTLLTLVARHTFWRLDWPMDGFFYDGHWLQFAAGILVYYWRNYAVGYQRWLSIMLLLIGAVYGLRHGAELLDASVHEQGVLVAFVSGGLIMLLDPWDKSLAARRWFRPLLFCGKISYSVYLVHWPITKGLSHGLYEAGLQSHVATAFVTVPLCLATTLLAAWLFHRMVERHFLNPKQFAKK